MKSPGRIKYTFGTPEILYDIEKFCIEIYDKFTDLIFDDRDKYYIEMKSCPLLVYRWGLDSDFVSSKDDFNLFVQNDKARAYFQHLFLADCHNLIGSLQNRVNSTPIQLNNFLSHLDAVKVTLMGNDGYFWTTGENVIQVFASLHDLIITMYASFDLIAKISFQLENMPDKFEKYQKMKSKNILYGNKNWLRGISIPDTIFENCKTIKIIENLRHELIHNGTWESLPKVHYKVENGEVVNKWILQPDFNEAGILETVTNSSNSRTARKPSNSVIFKRSLRKHLINICG